MNKQLLCGTAGIIGSFISNLCGGWTATMTTLVIMMCIDYVSGLMVAGVFHNSTKTESGALESRAGWKGLCRKGMTLLIVLVSYRLDLALGTAYVQEAVAIGFIANEGISIIENAGLMGIPLPDALIKAIDILNSKEKKVVD